MLILAADHALSEFLFFSQLDNGNHPAQAFCENTSVVSGWRGNKVNGILSFTSRKYPPERMMYLLVIRTQYDEEKLISNPSLSAS